MIELTVLGAGPAYTARPGAVGAAYLLRCGDATLVLDLGQGAFTNLAGAVEPSSVEAYVISHLHPDHFIDLVPLRHYLHWDFDPPRRVRVIGPGALGDRLDALHDQPGFAAASLDIEPLGGAGIRELGPFRVEPRLVRHTDESYAFRVSAGDGPGLVYSGDCGRADDVLPLIRPGDTLLSEASFGTAGGGRLGAPQRVRRGATRGSGLGRPGPADPPPDGSRSRRLGRGDANPGRRRDGRRRPWGPVHDLSRGIPGRTGYDAMRSLVPQEPVRAHHRSRRPDPPRPTPPRGRASLGGGDRRRHLAGARLGRRAARGQRSSDRPTRIMAMRRPTWR